MKKRLLLIGLFIPLILGNLQSQVNEIGLGINANMLKTFDSYISSVNSRGGIGLSVFYRHQNPLKTNVFLKNNEIGLEYNRASIALSSRTSPGGAGGNSTSYKANVLCLNASNYFVNFNTLDQPIQVALGLSVDYKLMSTSEGYVEEQHIGRDPNTNQYYFTYTKTKIKGNEAQLISSYNIGPKAQIGFPPFSVGELRCTARFTTGLFLGPEVKRGPAFCNARSRFEVSIILPEKKAISAQ